MSAMQRVRIGAVERLATAADYAIGGLVWAAMLPAWAVHRIAARRRAAAIIAAAGLATAAWGGTNGVPDAAEIGRSIAQQIILCEQNNVKTFESRLITPGGGLVNVIYRADPSGQKMKWGIGIGAGALLATTAAVGSNNGLFGETHHGRGTKAEQAQARRDTGATQADGNSVSVTVDQSGEGEKNSTVQVFIGNIFAGREAGEI